jgi:hypothetical protein
MIDPGAPAAAVKGPRASISDAPGERSRALDARERDACEAPRRSSSSHSRIAGQVRPAMPHNMAPPAVLQGESVAITRVIALAPAGPGRVGVRWVGAGLGNFFPVECGVGSARPRQPGLRIRPRSGDGVTPAAAPAAHHGHDRRAGEDCAPHERQVAQTAALPRPHHVANRPQQRPHRQQGRGQPNRPLERESRREPPWLARPSSRTLIPHPETTIVSSASSCGAGCLGLLRSQDTSYAFPVS